MHSSSDHVSGSPAAPSIIRTRVDAVGDEAGGRIFASGDALSQRTVPGAYSTVQSRPSFALKMLTAPPVRFEPYPLCPRSGADVPSGVVYAHFARVLYHIPPMPQSAAIQPKAPLVRMFCQRRPEAR